MADKLLAARNSALFGLTFQERRSGNYQNHSLIRNDWKSQDILRDAYANVPVIAHHPTNPDSVKNRSRAQGSVSVPFRNAPAMQDQLKATTPALVLTDTSFGVYQEGSTDEVLFAKWSWNNAKVSANATTAPGQPGPGNVRSLLFKENEGTLIEGVPYFSKYYHQDPSETEGPIGMQPSEVRMAGSAEAVPPLMNRLLEVENIYDHYFKYQTYDKTDVENGSYNIAITPHYNFYLDSSPDYETAISSIPEPMIPNYYMLEIAFAAGSDDTPSSYKNALSLDFGMHWINTIIDKEGSLEALGQNPSLFANYSPSTQAMSQGYFQYYVSSLSSFADSSTPAYNNKYKNIAVLSEDLHDDVLGNYNQITRDDRGTTSDTSDDFPAIGNYPFYNHVDIPYNKQFTEGNIEDTEASLFQTLYGENPDYASFFLTVLQLLTIDIYNGSNTLSPSALPFNVYDKDTEILQSENTSTDLYFNLEEVMSLVQQYALDDTAEPAASFMQRLQFLAGQYMGTPLVEGDVAPNVVFIQSLVADDEDPHDVATWVSDSGELTDAQFAEFILRYLESWTRIFYDIFVGLAKPAASEAFMYIVEKRVIPDGSTSANPADAPVQTLFFGKDIKTERGINYYDTQIKYGVKYQYDIKQVRLVVGNRYKYTSADSIVNDGELHQGRAIGNALGFYAEEDMAVTNTVSFQRRLSSTSWTYLSEGGTTENHLTEQRGYFICKLSYGSRVSQLFPSSTNPEAPMGALEADYYNTTESPWWLYDLPSPAEQEQLFDAIPLMSRPGDGFDGNQSGGFVGGMLASAEEVGLFPGEEEPANENYVDPYTGYETSARVNEEGYFVNTSHDVEDEPSLIDLIVSIVDYPGTNFDDDFSGWKSKIIAIIRETVGPNAAMVAQLWIISFPAGAYVTSGSSTSWTQGNALVALGRKIINAVGPGNVESGVIGDFACQLETEFHDSAAISTFAATLNAEFRDIC